MKKTINIGSIEIKIYGKTYKLKLEIENINRKFL